MAEGVEYTSALQTW